MRIIFLLTVSALLFGERVAAQDAPGLAASPPWLIGIQAVRYPGVAWAPEELYINQVRPWPAQLVVRRRLGRISLETGLALYFSSPGSHEVDYGSRRDTYSPSAKTYLIPLVSRIPVARKLARDWRFDVVAGLLLIKRDYYCPATSYDVKTGQQSAYTSGDFGEYFVPLNVGLGITYQFRPHLCLTADARVLWNGFEPGSLFVPSELLPTFSVGAGYAFSHKQRIAKEPG